MGTAAAHRYLGSDAKKARKGSRKRRFEVRGGQEQTRGAGFMAGGRRVGACRSGADMRRPWLEATAANRLCVSQARNTAGDGLRTADSG
ncbi:hypothetical protein GCM10023170_037190 [Phytohabitans houttuyneae]|uniref:Uncharacterized protein n=1 Tax=Phytohabitans houttuyneae TaxID=1076126 RepID=A0A6V8KED6_9ACTN|nr:hypothetical protein Phou_048780 [Phytohabitans houttuyneae]